jgi:hypothetical protein
MADGTVTVTIDTNEWTYLDHAGIAHVVTNGQTFTLASTDTGDGAILRPNVDQSVSCTDGTRITIHSYNSVQGVVVPAGDTAVTNNNSSLGEWVMSCSSDDIQERWKCSGLDVDDADAITEFTDARFEKVENPAHVFTWDGVTAAFA